MSVSDIMGLDGKLLVTFCVVAQELHFGRAAQRLCISQPPLSQQIKRLEQLVGTPLFERTTRSVSLTPAGAVMFHRASQLCTDMQSMLQLTRQSAHGGHGSLRVGLAPSAGYSPVVLALQSYRRQHPQIALSLHEMNSVQMPAALRTRELDVAIMRPFAAPADLDLQCVHREAMGLVACHDDLVGSVRVSLAQVAQAPLVGYEAAHSPYFRQLLDELFRQAGLTPCIVQESRLPTILTLVEAGVGRAIVPWSLARLHADTLRFIPIDELAPQPASLVMATLRGIADPNPTVANFVATMLAQPSVPTPLI